MIRSTQFGRGWLWALLALASLQVADPAAAHTGTTHAETPHWLLLVAVLVGLGIAVAGGYALRGRRRSAGLVALFAGGIVAGFGGIGLVEIQIVSTVGPRLTEIYPLATLLVGATVMVTGLLGGLLFWSERPRYTALAIVLGGWVLYPTLFPSEGVSNPVGYLLVLSLPLTVVYLLATDAAPLLRAVFSRRLPKVVAGLAFVLVVLFLAVSAGTLSLNPDWGPSGPPAEAFVTAIPVAAPLVYWPAVEFVVPSVPLSGMVSVGTLILFGTLGALVAINVAILTVQVRSEREQASATSMAGTIATTGATACCCCAPAIYGVISAAVGAAASPVYWAFMDPTSPLGTFFLALSVTLLTTSIVRTAMDADGDRLCGLQGAASSEPTASSGSD